MRQTTSGLTVARPPSCVCHGWRTVVSGGGARSHPRSPPRRRVPPAWPRGVAGSNPGAPQGAHSTRGRSGRPPTSPLTCAALQDAAVRRVPPPGLRRHSACGSVRPSPCCLECLRHDRLAMPPHARGAEGGSGSRGGLPSHLAGSVPVMARIRRPSTSQAMAWPRSPPVFG
jgi:hypothetical protein